MWHLWRIRSQRDGLSTATVNAEMLTGLASTTQQGDRGRKAFKLTCASSSGRDASDTTRPHDTTLMSTTFYMLNCVAPSNQHQLIKPWVVPGTIQGLDRPCIINTGCNLTAIPITVTRLLQLRIKPANIQVTIADGSSYTPLGLILVAITVAGITATVEALVKLR